MSPLNDSTFSPSPNDNDLYAVPIKKKRKQHGCFPFRNSTNKPKPTPKWSNYDEVGALIEGTYEAPQSPTEALDIDSPFGESSHYTKPKQRVQPKAETNVVDDPYEMIGRSNSFSPGRLTKKETNNKTPETAIKLLDTALRPLDNEDEPSEMSLKAIEHSGIPFISSFKPGGSLRIKQQRTSMRKGREKENINFLNSTHEDVTITPPTSGRSSPAISTTSLNEHSKVTKTEESPLTQENRTHSYQDILDIIDSADAKDTGRDNKDADQAVDHPYELIENITLDKENKKDQSENKLVDNKNKINDKRESSSSNCEKIWDNNIDNENKETVNQDKVYTHETDNQDNEQAVKYTDVEIIPRTDSNSKQKVNTPNYVQVALVD